MSEEAEDPAAYRAAMAEKKAEMDARIRAARERRGVLMVLTGDGKGKSSSAYGMVARALGHGMHVGVIQFIKGRFKTGEQRFFTGLDGVSWHVMGEGFTWETQDRERDRQAAEAAWKQARQFLADESVALVVLDELNIVLDHGTLDLDEVLSALAERPSGQHVVVTGRRAPQALRDAADTVTEMRPERHAFEQGIKAQKGVEL